MFSLPEQPSEFGAYWLSPLPDGPVIFPSKRLVATRHENVVEPNGTYLLYLNADDGFVFNGGGLKQFATPMAALRELNSRLSCTT